MREVDKLKRGSNLEPTSDFLIKLAELKMIVDDDVDEDIALNTRYIEFENESELYIMLIVTRNCNFRCAYCYENCQDFDMTNSVYDSVIKCIIKLINEKRYRKVIISFFGGEPTLKSKEIISFMKKLNNENSKLLLPAQINAMMTSNGYLLDDETVKQFVDNVITRYQITLDGPESIHNKSRYLKNGEGTWQTIYDNLQNMKKYSDEGVSVLIRCNVTPECNKNIDDWLLFLHESFGDKIFTFHFETAKNFGSMNDESFELIDDEVSTIMEIIEKSKKYSLSLELVGFGLEPFSAVCYAARRSSYIIDFDGTVKKCTSSSLDEPYNKIGFISNDGLKLDNRKEAAWTSYKMDEECMDCDVLPLCYMRKCPATKGSHDGCNFLIKSYYAGLRYFYLS